MGKEVKIGLSVIGTLLVVLGGTLYWRLNYTKPRVAANTEVGSASETQPKQSLLESTLGDAPTDAATASQWARHAGHSTPEEDATATESSAYTDYTSDGSTTGEHASAATEDAASNYTSARASEAPNSGSDPFQGRAKVTTEVATDDGRVASTTDAETQTEHSPQQFDHETATGAAEIAAESAGDEDLSAETSTHDAATLAAAREPVARARTAAGTRSTAGGAKAVAQPASSRSIQPDVEEETPATEQSSADRRQRYLDTAEEDATSESADSVAPESGLADEESVSDRVVVAHGKYKIQPNDNFWTISEKLYGTGGYFKALQAYNRTRSPQQVDDLQVGDAISAPPVEELVKAYPNLCPKQRKLPAQNLARQASTRRPLGAKVYVVAEGDSLFDVARYELGKASRWAEIYDLNRDVLGEDFDYLKPGTELVLPSDAREEERVTRQPTGRQLR